MSSVWTPGGDRLPRLSSVAIFLVLASYLLLVLFPIYWIIVSSFKIPVDTLAVPPVWVFTPTLDAYLNVFAVNNYLRFFLNSAIVAVGTVAIALSCGSLAAYALDRVPFRFSGLVSYGLLDKCQLIADTRMCQLIADTDCDNGNDGSPHRSG